MGVEKKMFPEIFIFTIWHIWPHLFCKNSCPGSHEIYNLGRPILCYHYYLLSLSDVCMGLGKKILKEKRIYTIWVIWPHPSIRTLALVVIGRPFLGHHNYILNVSDLCMGVEEKIFKGIMHFHYMTYSIRTPALGSWNLQFW